MYNEARMKITTSVMSRKIRSFVFQGKKCDQQHWKTVKRGPSPFHRTTLLLIIACNLDIVDNLN